MRAMGELKAGEVARFYRIDKNASGTKTTARWRRIREGRISQRLELELDAQGEVIGLGQQTRTEGISVETTEARIFHSQAQRLSQIVAQTQTIVDAVALAPRVSDDQCQRHRPPSDVPWRITQR